MFLINVDSCVGSGTASQPKNFNLNVPYFGNLKSRTWSWNFWRFLQ